MSHFQQIHGKQYTNSDFNYLFISTLTLPRSLYDTARTAIILIMDQDISFPAFLKFVDLGMKRDLYGPTTLRVMATSAFWDRTKYREKLAEYLRFGFDKVVLHGGAT